MPPRPRLLLVVAPLLVGVATTVLLLGGVPRVVVTHGVSMRPHFVAGDLALLVPTTSCVPGRIEAYRDGREVLLHRTVAVVDGRCVFKGDNNDWTDPTRPLPSQLLGTLVLRVPGGGAWWRRLTSPTLLGVVAFTLVAAVGSPGAGRRSRRRRRSTGTPLPRPLSLL